MLREIWRTVSLLHLASKLRLTQDGSVYWRKRRWHGGPTNTAYRIDETSLRALETATIDAALLVPCIILLALTGLAFAPLWLASVAVLMMAWLLWLSQGPVRRIRRNCEVASIREVFVANGIQTLELQYVRTVMALGGVAAVGGLVSSFAVEVQFYDHLEGQQRAALNMLGYLCFFGGFSLARSSSDFDPANEPEVTAGRSSVTAVNNTN
ncbi:hypothetical protein [Dongia sp.]|uniref:hypothetical protein n=1 Tax=Dongia sp. TaxID=1977262 RepID=UPI003750053A